MNRKFLEHKLKNFTPDAVMTNDNAAYTFAVQYRDELFKDAAVIFAGFDLHGSRLGDWPGTARGTFHRGVQSTQRRKAVGLRVWLQRLRRCPHEV